MNVLNRRAYWLASWFGLAACHGSDVPGHNMEVDAGKSDDLAPGETADDSGVNALDAATSDRLDAAAASDSSTPDIQPDAGNDAGEPGPCVPGEARDILMVLDRSGSMKMGGVDRWTPVSMGINTIVSEAEEHTRLGLMLFPGAGGQCASGKIDVPIALHSAASFAQALAEEPEGGTPTANTLAEAKAALSGATRPTIVVLITDGEPNCGPTLPIFDPNGQIDPNAFESERLAREATEAAIKELATAGIKTYVIGVDATNPDLKKTLDTFALAGGTGETMHRPVLSEDDVAATLRSLLTPGACE